jgi:m7GpppX diphosphatase
MSHPAAPKDLKRLQRFKFERILNEDTLTHSIIFLGYLPDSDEDDDVQAIIRIEKTALDPVQVPSIFQSLSGIDKVVLEQSTDIVRVHPQSEREHSDNGYPSYYSLVHLDVWLARTLQRTGRENQHHLPSYRGTCPKGEGFLSSSNGLCSAPVKYMRQEQLMVRETPELYDKIVKPYIDGFPASRTKWYSPFQITCLDIVNINLQRVDNILSGLSEKDKVLVSTPDYLILPDMKWDRKTVSSLYLVAIVQDRSIRTLRDLTKKHIGLLCNIRDIAQQTVLHKWGLERGSLRMYVHYQPSYC